MLAACNSFCNVMNIYFQMLKLLYHFSHCFKLFCYISSWTLFTKYEISRLVLCKNRNRLITPTDVSLLECDDQTETVHV